MSGQILVIAEQQRLQRLFDGMAEAQARGVTVVAGLAGAADQLDAAEPGLILVQDRLSGLSGELIVRHLRSRFANVDALIVLATESADTFDAVSDSLQVVDTRLPDLELLRQLERLVIRLPRVQQDLPPEPATLPATDDDFIPLVVPTGAVAVVESTPEVCAEPPVEPPPVPAALGDTDDETPLETAGVTSGVVSRFEAELETELARREPTASSFPAAGGAEPALSVDEMMTATTAPSSGSSKRTGRIIAACAVLFVLAGIIWFGQQTTPAPPPPSAAQQQSVAVNPVPAAAPAQVKAALPAAETPPAVAPAKPDAPAVSPPRFVGSAQAIADPAYGRDHAGWERYLTPTLEFKLYREQGKLLAVQVVDRAGEGISPRLFTAAMEELTKVRDYRSEGREVKGDYLVKKGRLASGGKVLIYKDRQDTVLHGFVIYFN